MHGDQRRSIHREKDQHEGRHVLDLVYTPRANSFPSRGFIRVSFAPPQALLLFFFLGTLHQLTVKSLHPRFILSLEFGIRVFDSAANTAAWRQGLAHTCTAQTLEPGRQISAISGIQTIQLVAASLSWNQCFTEDTHGFQLIACLSVIDKLSPPDTVWTGRI